MEEFWLTVLGGGIAGAVGLGVSTFDRWRQRFQESRLRRRELLAELEEALIPLQVAVAQALPDPNPMTKIVGRVHEIPGLDTWVLREPENRPWDDVVDGDVSRTLPARRRGDGAPFGSDYAQVSPRMPESFLLSAGSRRQRSASPRARAARWNGHELLRRNSQTCFSSCNVRGRRIDGAGEAVRALRYLPTQPATVR